MQNFPDHIAIVMDGNRRWAKKRLMPGLAGHKAGATALKKLVEDLNKEGLKFLSVYAFSTENWKRDKEEVDHIMALMREYIDDYLSSDDKNAVRLTVIGEKSRLPIDLQDKINHIEKSTIDNKGLRLIVALNYGGRDEIVRAAKKLSTQMIKANINIDDVDEDFFCKFLDTKDIPDPDLLIRTSGEQRTSNFLLWQTAYSELYFTDKLWPDFTLADLKEAVADFQSRKRRFGGV